MDLTGSQQEKISTVARRFGAEDDITVTREFDLPADWVLVTVGERKGRPKTFAVGPNGEART